MFAASPRLRLLAILLMGILAITVVVMVGIPKKEKVDPYLHASLRAVTQGDTLSPGFLFDIDAPTFEFVYGNTGVVREANHLDFIVGQDLENIYRNLAGTRLGVRKAFTPKPTHLVLERIMRNGRVEADSLPTPAPITLPRLLSASAIDLQAPGAALPEIGWDAASIEDARLSYMPQKDGESFRLVKSAYENFVYAPKHDLPAEKRANPAPEDYAWYLIGKKGSIQVVDLTVGGDWMLHLLKAKNLPLIGAFTLVALNVDPASRQVDHPAIGHVVGLARLNWFQYANTYVQGCTVR
jgi:hypothetical protein